MSGEAAAARLGLAWIVYLKILLWIGFRETGAVGSVGIPKSNFLEPAGLQWDSAPFMFYCSAQAISARQQFWEALLYHEVEPIGVALPDYDSVRAGNTDEGVSLASARVQQRLEDEYGLAFFSVSIGTGAALPGLLTWLPSAAIGGAIWLFSQGEKIEPNVQAWRAFYDRYLGRFIGKYPTIDRGGSIVLAVRALSERLGHEPATIQLKSYKRRSNRVEEEPRGGATGEIDDRQERIEASSIHVFLIEADGQSFTICVESDQVTFVEE